MTSRSDLGGLDDLRFDNLSLRALPIDSSAENRIRQVPGACFSRVAPTPVKLPTVVALSGDALALVGVSEAEAERPDAVEKLAGNAAIPGAETAAHCYCGHQFGNFAGQLGDGATMYIGEVVNPRGERWELQYKGAGLTPYSRSADGRKVLRSSLREFLCSEAMHALGVPTTRAGSIVTSDTRIMRDPLYDGHPVAERATVITRIAPSFLRIGSLQIALPRDDLTGRAGPSCGLPDGGKAVLKRLMEHAASLFPGLPASDAEARAAGIRVPTPRPGTTRDEAARFAAVCDATARRTAHLCAAWAAVGWCHGVLNTDNISLLGLTIDYGPFAFMDRFDPDHICNGSDDGGRYSFRNQPVMARWDLRKMAEAIDPLVDAAHVQAQSLAAFDDAYATAYMALFRAKLGLHRHALRADSRVIESLLATMHATGADWTNAFRLLSLVPLPADATRAAAAAAVSPQLVAAFAAQCASRAARLAASEPGRVPQAQIPQLRALARDEPHVLMRLGLMPGVVRVILRRADEHEAMSSRSDAEHEDAVTAAWRTWLIDYAQRIALERLASAEAQAGGEALLKHLEAEGAAAAEEEDYAAMAGPMGPFGDVDADSLRLRRAVRDPRDTPPAREAVGPTPSDAVVELARARVEGMLGVNPRRVLRNHVAQEAIAAAEAGDFGPARALLARLRRPYDTGDLDVEALADFVAGRSDAGALAGSGEGIDFRGAVRCPLAIASDMVDPLPPVEAVRLRVTCSS